MKNKQILSPTYFSSVRTKSLKNIAPEPQSIFSKNEKKLFLWKKPTKSKTPGLSFSSRKWDFAFLKHLVKKVRTPNLDFVQIQSSKETFEYT